MTENGEPQQNNINKKEEHINAAYEALEKMRKMNLELQCCAHGVAYDDECCTTCLLSEKSANIVRFPRLSKWALQLQQQDEGRSQENVKVDESAGESNSHQQDTASTTTTETTSRFPRLSKWALQIQQQPQQVDADESAAVTTDEGSTNSHPIGTPNTTTSRFPRIHRLIHSEKKRPKAPPCLICGTPVCKQHSSNDFLREGLTICLECQHLFGLQFVVDFLTETQHETRRHHLDHLLDIYDRVVLLLTYSAQYIPTIAEQLEQSKQRQNHIGLGSSSVGMVSGALGIVAAATIMTPVGPPLLVASLLFGGGSTAVQTGSDAMHYYSEPQQLAKRIISLHSMLWNILHITGILRDAMLREHVRSDFYDEPSFNSHFSDPQFQNALDQKKGALISAAGLTSLGRCSAISAAEMSQAGSQGARWMSRTTMNLMRGARVARFAGGAMSATVLVLEAKNVSDTVRAIHSGSPCEQAQQLRLIHGELVQKGSIPDTASLDNELHRYLAIVNQRERVWTEEQVAQIILEQNEQACREEELLEQLKLEQNNPEESQQVVIYDEELSATSTTINNTSSSTKGGSLSLLERIAMFKQKQTNPEQSGPQIEEVGAPLGASPNETAAVES